MNILFFRLGFTVDVRVGGSIRRVNWKSFGSYEVISEVGAITNRETGSEYRISFCEFVNQVIRAIYLGRKGIARLVEGYVVVEFVGRGKLEFVVVGDDGHFGGVAFVVFVEVVRAIVGCEDDKRFPNGRDVCCGSFLRIYIRACLGLVVACRIAEVVVGLVAVVAACCSVDGLEDARSGHGAQVSDCNTTRHSCTWAYAEVGLHECEEH